MQKKIDSVSFIEVPDYQNYIIKGSILLTTLYPIHDDDSAIKNLILYSHKAGVSALVIKSKRYIDSIPKEIIDIANNLDFIIIELSYDANLSLISSSISAAIYNTHSIVKNNEQKIISQLFSILYKSENFTQLIENIIQINIFDLYIEFKEDKNNVYTSKDLVKKINENSSIRKKTINLLEDSAIIKKDIIHENSKIATLYLEFTKNTLNQAHNYMDIISFFTIYIYQKEKENQIEQVNMLNNFLSVLLKYNKNNASIIKFANLYNWNIKFPIALINITFLNLDKQKQIDSTHEEYISLIISSTFNLTIDKFHLFHINNTIFIILNISNIQKYEVKCKLCVEKVIQEMDGLRVGIAISKLIFNSQDIPNSYINLTDIISSFSEINKGENFYVFEKDFDLIHLLENIDFKTLVDFMNKSIKPIIEYDEIHNSQLLHTLYTFINNKFNIKKSAEKLFIHYNTLRYRITLLRDLGYDLDSDSFPIGAVYSAIQIYFFLYNKSKP